MQPHEHPDVIKYSALLATSFRFWTGRAICSDLTPKGLFEMAMPLVSHGTEADPIFCYGNLAALKLWEMSWDEFTALPSRKSAEAVADIQSDRSKLMAEAIKNGFVENYTGWRISKSGSRFMISKTLLWNAVDSRGVVLGQAALIGNVG